MGRSAVTVQSLSAYNTAGVVTLDAIDTSNHHSIDVDGVKGSNLAIFIETLDTAPLALAIKAGDYSDAGIGDLDLTSVTAKTQVVCLETARFKDEDDYILIDASSTSATPGYIYAVELP